MNAKAWFYSTGFNNSAAQQVERSSYASHQQVSELQTCPLCRGSVDMSKQMWAKLNGKIAHDYCVRTKGDR